MRPSRIFPIFQNGMKAVTRRPLHTTPRALAGTQYQKGRAKPKQTRTRPAVPIHTPAALPPLSVLELEHKNGRLDINPSTALDFLKQYQLLSHQAPAGWEQGLCKRYQISPSTITSLGMAIGYSTSSEQKALARHLLISSANLGDVLAIILMAKYALRFGELDIPSYRPILQKLSILAKKERNPQAAALLGEILTRQGRGEEALGFLRDAVATPTEDKESLGTMGELCARLGHILLLKGALEEAEKVLWKGALEYDNPASYFYLSNLQAQGSPENIMYLEKAAASGIPEACHNLGVLELRKIEKYVESKSIAGQATMEVKDYGLTKEWFQVAAEAGFGRSMVSLSMICRVEGRAEEGDDWLRRAAKIPEFKEEALKLLHKS
ncbi:Tetratricopeptide-like helical domain protein [Rutstroemia sp. NJR-2017a WRK4]|nr:Tetratricopeptide-like helical domain protein [Rutstroemia sp. NJR-2017a WRK4]PQE11780.1 Tetratricopeptide-like helical domain protein [Rutstroemia sp. NJR-2017a WRK4]